MVKKGEKYHERLYKWRWLTVQTIRCKLVALNEGTYTVYVFEDLNKDFTDIHKYIMCTRVPNWNTSDVPEINDIGYLQYQFVNGGDKYFKAVTETMECYKSTAYYFINFIKEKEKINNKEFNF